MKKNYFKSLVQVAILLCAPLFIASCDEFGTEDNPAGAYPSINTAAVTINLKYGVDPTYKRTAIAASAAAIEYSSSDEKVATVDETGVVTGVGAGTCDIIAKPYFIKNGSKLYTNEEVKYPVTVKDWRAQVKFAEAEALVNSADIVDNEFKLDKAIYPAGATVTYSSVAAPGKTNAVNIDANTGALTIANPNGVSIITAKITAVPTTDYEMVSFKDGDGDVKATFTLTVKEGIAYVSGYDAEGEPIRTTMFLKDENDKDQYTKIDNAWIAAHTADVILDGGIYYVEPQAAPTNFPTAPILTNSFNHNVKIKGNATFILADNSNFEIVGAVMDDTPDAHTINIYGQKLQSGILHPYGTAGDRIMDFEEINVYGGMLRPSCGSDGSGALNKISSVNIYKGGILFAESYASYGYGIKMNTGGKVTVDGGTLRVVGKGSNADASYALIGDVVVKNKGELKASSASYRAINGTVTATTAMACDDTTWNPTATGYDGTWAAFTSTTSKKYVWAK